MRRFTLLAALGAAALLDSVLSMRGVLAQDESGSGTDTGAFEADVSRFDESRLVVWGVAAVSVFGFILLITYLCLRAGAPLNWLIAKPDAQYVAPTATTYRATHPHRQFPDEGVDFIGPLTFEQDDCPGLEQPLRTYSKSGTTNTLVVFEGMPLSHVITQNNTNVVATASMRANRPLAPPKMPKGSIVYYEVKITQMPVPLQEMFGAAYKAEFDSSSSDDEATAIGRARKRRRERQNNVTSPASAATDDAKAAGARESGSSQAAASDANAGDTSADAMERGAARASDAKSPDAKSPGVKSPGVKSPGQRRTRRSRSRSPAYRRSRSSAGSTGESPANGRAGRRGRGVLATKAERAQRAKEFQARALKNAERAKQRKNKQAIEDKLKKHREHMRAVVKELVPKSAAAASGSDPPQKQSSGASDEGAIGLGMNLPEHMDTAIGWATKPFPPFMALGEEEVSLGINMKGQVVCGSRGVASVMLHPEGLQVNDVVGCGYEHVDDFADPDEEVSMIEGFKRPKTPGVVFFFTLNGKRLPSLPKAISFVSDQAIAARQEAAAHRQQNPDMVLLATGCAYPAISVHGFWLGAGSLVRDVKLNVRYRPPFLWGKELRLGVERVREENATKAQLREREKHRKAVEKAMFARRMQVERERREQAAKAGRKYRRRSTAQATLDLANELAERGSLDRRRSAGVDGRDEQLEPLGTGPSRRRSSTAKKKKKEFVVDASRDPTEHWGFADMFVWDARLDVEAMKGPAGSRAQSNVDWDMVFSPRRRTREIRQELYYVQTTDTGANADAWLTEHTNGALTLGSPGALGTPSTLAGRGGLFGDSDRRRSTPGRLTPLHTANDFQLTADGAARGRRGSGIVVAGMGELATAMVGEEVNATPKVSRVSSFQKLMGLDHEANRQRRLKLHGRRAINELPGAKERKRKARKDKMLGTAMHKYQVAEEAREKRLQQQQAGARPQTALATRGF